MRQAPFHALFVFFLLVVMLMKADAQAPSSIAGQTFTVDVTSGTYPPFASSGYFLLLPAVSGDDYQIIGIYGIESSSGTYSYSGAGATGTAQLLDEGAGSVEESVTFDTPTTGSYEATSARYSTSQTGNFEMFSAPVSTSLLGKKITCSVETGLTPFADAGTFIFEAATSGSTYQVTGDGINTPNSSGTYSFSKVNGNTGKLQMDDSVYGAATIYFAFSSATNGGFAIKPSSGGGYQIGHFVATDTGSLQVTIAPPAAVTNGAQWQVDGGLLQTNDATVTNLTVGNHVVSFTTISNWTTPSNQTVSVLANSTTKATGTYVAQTGALQVFIKPAQAIKAGAKWLVQGSGFHPSGDIVADLSPGDKSVSFANIPGWLSPLDKTVTITVNQTNTIYVLYVDITPPTLAIVSPKSGQSVSNTPFAVTGTANDNVAVASVYVQVDGGSWTNAHSTNGFTNWSANANLVPGLNTVLAYAVDTSSNYSLTTNKVTFPYIPSATLTVQTNGHGGVSPNESGKLLAIGTNYTLTALPGKNWLFYNWVISGTEYSSSTNAVLNFTMQSNLTLTANFVTNPFLAMQGTYNGLFYQTAAGKPVTEQSSGFVTITIASTSKGAYSAALKVDGASYPFTGIFDLNGYSATNIPRKGKSPLTLMLHTGLNLNPPADSMTGSVEAADWDGPSSLQADLAYYNGTTLKASNYSGKYTFVLPGSPGYSVAEFANSLAGNAVLTGSLADNTTITSLSTPISKDGFVPIYYSYSPETNVIFGWLAFTNDPPQTVEGNLTWFKLPATKGLYSGGFTNQTNITGSLYAPAPAGGLVTNGTLTIADPDQGINLVYTNVSIIADKLTHIGTPTNQLTATITPSTGAISLSFRPTRAKANITAKGVMLQNSPVDPSLAAAGWFLGTNQTGYFILTR